MQGPCRPSEGPGRLGGTGCDRGHRRDQPAGSRGSYHRHRLEAAHWVAGQLPLADRLALGSSGRRRRRRLREPSDSEHPDPERGDDLVRLQLHNPGADATPRSEHTHS
jgi:hypothetical protein